MKHGTDVRSSPGPVVCPIEEAYKGVFALYKMLKRYFIAHWVDPVLLSCFLDLWCSPDSLKCIQFLLQINYTQEVQFISCNMRVPTEGLAICWESDLHCASRAKRFCVLGLDLQLWRSAFNFQLCHILPKWPCASHLFSQHLIITLLQMRSWHFSAFQRVMWG